MRRQLRFAWALALGLACGGKAQEPAKGLGPPGAPASNEVSAETATDEPDGGCGYCTADTGLGASIAGCLSGQMRCNGAELQQCKDDRSGFETVDVCASALHCSGGDVYCAPPCTPGVVICFGPSVQRCNDERFYGQVEFCPAGCDPVRAACRFPDAGAGG